MADIVTRSSVLAVTVESTEGTPVAPTLATQYMRLQDDADMSPEFEELENAEQSSSIGRSKSIRGAENPTFNTSHYLRHSGTEGSKPDTSEVLKAIFGAEVIASTEYDTVAGSTVSSVNVDTGEGSNFQRGQPMLYKDGVNGYSIRPVHSVATDAITPGFNLPGAPAAGVNTGKAVLYKPADSGHQSLNLWHYLGNSGAIQMMAGARPVSLDISAEAGQLINMAMAFEGIGYYFNPIEITSDDIHLDFDEDGSTEKTATITAKFYKDPHELADALQTAMNLQATAEITVTYSDTTGKYTIASDGATFNVNWNSGSNTATTVGNKIGFTVSADDTGALTYTSDNALDFSAPQTPAYDSADPLAAKNLEVLIGDADDTTSFEASSVNITVGTPKVSKPDMTAESGVGGSLITSREVSVNVSGYLSQYDSQKFRRYRENTDTRFLFNFGTKTGGNWNAGKCGMFYIPTGTISAFDLSDSEGLVAIDFTITAYVDSAGNGEVYLGFV